MNAQPFKEYDSNDKGEQEFDVTGAVTLDDTFIYDDAVPSTTIHVVVKAVAPATPANEENTYDDGGPFTTDICGNIYDRWNNKIYTAPGCKLDDGYVVPNTGAK